MTFLFKAGINKPHLQLSLSLPFEVAPVRAYSHYLQRIILPLPCVCVSISMLVGQPTNLNWAKTFSQIWSSLLHPIQLFLGWELIHSKPWENFLGGFEEKDDIDTIDGQEEVKERGPPEDGSKGKGWGKGEIGKRGKLEDGGEGKWGEC